MRDPFFERTLVLLWHHDDEGAAGVVVNREAPETIPEILVPGPEGVDLDPFSSTHVAWGGPVQGQAGTVIFRGAVADDLGWNLECGLAVSHSMDILVRLLENREHFLLCLGYAGWGAGQLDDEIVKGGWLWTDADPALVLDVPSDERYDRALATLGLTATSVWMQPIDE
jgi:putative transcriptional regulator